MNDALSVPSPSRFWSTLGMRKPAASTSACIPAPKYVATTRFRMRPTTRLSRMPAAIRKEAARLERGGVEAAAGAAALEESSFIQRGILAGALRADDRHRLKCPGSAEQARYAGSGM